MMPAIGTLVSIKNRGGLAKVRMIRKEKEACGALPIYVEKLGNNKGLTKVYRKDITIL